MVKFACLPALSVVKKKKSKGILKAADGSKGSSKAEPTEEADYGLKEHVFVEKASSIIPMVLSDDRFGRAEPTEEADYEGGDEHSDIRSMKRDYSDLDHQPKEELDSHGSNTDLHNYVFEKMETNKEMAAEAKIISAQIPVSVLGAPNLKGEPGQKLEDKWKKQTFSENQWAAFSLESSQVDRVNAWVNSLDDCSFIPVNVEEDCDGMEDEQTADVHNLETVESSEKTCSNTIHRVAEEVAQASNIIQSLNTFSTVAHIPGMGLKVIPSISAFACLRSVNLSGNSIVKITPGSLPKSLHTLDLSRNNISTIEGLGNLERLRILNLSYNRIAKISHGLSNCTLIKELYLAGNKISNVEGLHRLLKLTVLDLSFNRIITGKGLGQLVANYNSLLAVNLLGNPIQANIGDDQLRKEVLSLLPHVTYLNKQPIKPHKVREVVSEKVTKAALGDAAGSSKRKLTKRLSHGSGSLPKSKDAETSKHGKRRHSTSGK